MTDSGTPEGSSTPPPAGEPPGADPDVTVPRPVDPPPTSGYGQDPTISQPVYPPPAPGYGPDPTVAQPVYPPSGPPTSVPDPTTVGYAQATPYGDQPPPDQRDRHRGLVWVVVGLGVVIVALLGGLIWALSRNQDVTTTAATTITSSSTTTSTTSPPATPPSTAIDHGTGEGAGGGGPSGGGGSGGGGGGSGGGGGGGGGHPSSTTTTTSPPPQVTSVTAPSTFSCGGMGTVPPVTQLTLSWNTTNAQSVTVAIDDPNGAYQSGLPPNGSLLVPAPCSSGDTQTYYVIAIGAGGTRATKSVTTTGV